MSAPNPPRPTSAPASTLAQAALANIDIRSYLIDPRYAGIWTVKGILRHPTVRVVFEHAEVIGGAGESLAAARHKNFGRFLNIRPFGPKTRCIPAGSCSSSRPPTPSAVGSSNAEHSNDSWAASIDR